MSIVPIRPEDPPPAKHEPMDEGWALLEGLRRRLDDQTTLTRKTQQQVGQLTESIASLVNQHHARTRRINLNSFVAYLIFTVLCLVGFYILYNSRANELVEARDHANQERETAVKRADELAAKVAARDEADTRSWEVFQLLESGKRGEASAKLATIQSLRLSRVERTVLAARAHETQIMEVDAALRNATASFKAGRYQEVIAPLEAALVTEPNGMRAASMRYFLGIAHAKAGTLDKAVSYLQAAVDADVDHDDARFQLASALDRNGAWGKAKIQYDKFATAFPQSQFAPYAMHRSALLARLPPVAPPKPAGEPPPEDPTKVEAPGAQPKVEAPGAQPRVDPKAAPRPAPAPVKPAPAPIAPAKPAPAAPIAPAKPADDSQAQ